MHLARLSCRCRSVATPRAGRAPTTIQSETHMRIPRSIPLAAIAMFASAAVAGAQAPAHHPKAETQAELQKEATMTMADARAMALRTVPNARIQAGEIEREGGKLIYSFDMKVPHQSGIDEVNIDAMTGQLVSHQHETPRAERAEAAADAKAAKRAKAEKGEKTEEKAEKAEKGDKAEKAEKGDKAEDAAKAAKGEKADAAAMHKP